jgi:hypothetical protein
MIIFPRKGYVDNADLMSRRPDYFRPDDVHIYRPTRLFALYSGPKELDLCNYRNCNLLLVFSADTISVDDDFVTNLKTTYSSCFFLDSVKSPWKHHERIKSSDGLYFYHDRLVMPRPAQ